MQDIELIFSPRSIAIVGASPDLDSWATRNFLEPLLIHGYQGKIYPVNPYRSDVLGLKTYANIRQIPERVDYVVCAIPAPLTLQVIQDCVAAKAKVVCIYTAGFSETGEEEGKRLERELVETARQGGVRIIGPNCLGVHCPKAGISFEATIRSESGYTSFLSQSGGNAREFILSGAQQGIYFNKLISYGNAADLNEADFLEYFARDTDTKIIAAYIEGIKQPQRFHKVLGEVSQRKPVIILKGGQTEAGTRAVASHTGALAGTKEMWDTLCRQRNVIQVYNLEEVADAILAFLYLQPPRGRRVGIVGIGGGASVQAADDCERAGLIVPPFPEQLRQEIRKFTPPAGTSVLNPVDTSPDVLWSPALFSKTVELMANYDGVDVLIVAFLARQVMVRGVQSLREQIEAAIEGNKGSGKPLAIVLHSANIFEAEKIDFEVQPQCFKAGFPAYRSVARAAQAISRFIGYHENRDL